MTLGPNIESARWLALGVFVCSHLVSPVLGQEAARPAGVAGPPDVLHQAAYCTISDRAIAVCAVVTDDSQIAKVRTYFRASGERDFCYVEMVSDGDEYCGTLPAPRDGKMDALEYYIQAIDDSYESKRTSTKSLELQEPEVCGFPPVERDPARARAITVYATQREQRRLDDAFLGDGVTFVPKR